MQELTHLSTDIDHHVMEARSMLIGMCMQSTDYSPIDAPSLRAVWASHLQENALKQALIDLLEDEVRGRLKR